MVEELDEIEQMFSIIINEALYVHRSIGPGMLENVYKTCLVHQLKKKGLFVETEKPVPVFFDEVKMDCGYRTYIVVEKQIIIEAKIIEAKAPIHISRVLTYLRFLDLQHGIVFNFNSSLLKNSIKRVIRGY